MPDRINAFNWHDCEKYENDVKYFQELIKIRNEQPVFRDEAGSINQLHELPEGIFGVEINHPLTDKKVKCSNWQKVLLLFNQSLKAIEIPIQQDSWKIAVENEKYAVRNLDSNTYLINSLSFSLLFVKR
jgi:pullulanase